jgi:energy-coupling factor transporter ATP-binding protein EcfA2
VSSLLRIGDNLDRGLTGLENVEEQRQLRKIPDADAAAFARAIFEFAELTGAEDAPVRTYSTGMALRLSVALAVHGNPDILLMDDVLGVGDIAFQQKFIDRLHELKDGGSTMLLALSDDGLVRRLATRVVTLEAGTLVADGPPHARPDRRDLRKESPASREVVWRVADAWPENDVAMLDRIDVRSDVTEGSSLDLCLQYRLKTAPQRCRPLIDLMIGKVAAFRSVYPTFIELEKPGILCFSVRVPTELIAEGRCHLEASLVSIVGPSIYSLKTRDAITIDIRRSLDPVGDNVLLDLPDLPWDVGALPS